MQASRSGKLKKWKSIDDKEAPRFALEPREKERIWKKGLKVSS